MTDAQIQTARRLCLRTDLQPHERRFAEDLVRSATLSPGLSLTMKQTRWLAWLSVHYPSTTPRTGPSAEDGESMGRPDAPPFKPPKHDR